MTTNKKGALVEAPENNSCCPDSTSNQGNTITILETVGPCLTKVYQSDGTTMDYGDAASFRVHVETVLGLRNFSEYHQDELRHSKHLAIIRGKFVGAEQAEKANVAGTYCRTNANFTDQPLNLFMIDIDGYRPGFADPIADAEQAVLDFFEDAKLGDAFKTCSFYWHLSSSAGMPGKEGILKCHVWLWSKTPYTCAQLTEWAKAIGPSVDRAVYRRVQIHYVCDPIFEEGRVDPVPIRCGFHQGETDYVDLVIDAETLAKARDQGAGEGGNDTVLKVLPSDKEGLIGAFHRAFSAEDVLLNFLEGECRPFCSAAGASVRSPRRPSRR
jgi:putative DNA primase/helicase